MKGNGWVDVDEPGPVVADDEVPFDMALHLRVAATESNEHGEGDQLAGGQINPGPGGVITEAVGGPVTLNACCVEEVVLVVGSWWWGRGGG